MILQLSTHFARKAVPLQSKRRKMKKKLCALRGLCVKLINIKNIAYETAEPNEAIWIKILARECSITP